MSSCAPGLRDPGVVLYVHTVHIVPVWSMELFHMFMYAVQRNSSLGPMGRWDEFIHWRSISGIKVISSRTAGLWIKLAGDVSGSEVTVR